jgi:hypothetical protein
MIYLTDCTITPLWQTVVPYLHIAAAYVPVCVVVCCAFSKEGRAQ